LEEQQSIPGNEIDNEHGEIRSFSTDVGRLFELGFNTGFLTAMQQRKTISSHFGDLYQSDLGYLRFPALMAKLYGHTGVISTWDKETLQRWSLFFLQKGYLAGVNFFDEYLQSFEYCKPHKPRDIVYLQCNFYGESSLGTYPKNERTAVQELMAQFHAQDYAVQLTEQDIQGYSSKGNFLRADTLMLLRYGKQWRILCIDLSVFSLRTAEEASDLTSIEKIRNILATELRYVRSKSVFTNLSIDTDIDTTSEEVLAGQLQHYFTAFKRKDKESVKLIQAASYAYSFYEFLKKQGILTENDSVLLNVVGYTDRSINAMSVNKEHIQLLATCADIYKAQSADQTIAEARSYVLDTIQKAAAKSFGNGRDFMKKLVHLVDNSDGLQWLEHEEKLEGFVNTRAPLTSEQLNATVREHLEKRDYQGKNILDVHASLITKALASQTPYLFLTGNPGIGKTTAVVKFLKSRAMLGEGFLFLYVSPRKQVNLDIIRKFKEEVESGLRSENLFALTTNSIIIRNNYSSPTVHYYSKNRRDTFREHGVKFIFDESEEARHQRASKPGLEEIQEGLVIDRGEQISGVLSSLCNALYAALDKPLSNAIVATVAIQSLKRTGNGGNTLRHLERIFEGAYSKEHGVIPDRMKEISKNIKHFFVMIDEVTGDESGAEFLDGIHTFIHRYELINSPYDINTKIIVADASIIDPQIIQQHLSDTTYEPNKIYFRRVSAEQGFSPLSIQPFTFKRDPAVVINANAYPASMLHINYKIGVDAFQYSEETFVERSKQLINTVQQHIIEDILAALNQKDAPQLLVYIQDKKRLALLIQAIRKLRGGAFEANQDYLEIHANISEVDRKAVEDFQEIARIVFMTASASRGLSFKRARHILVDIPHFEIEQNLMEILQVIYRGRGGDFDQDNKTLTFYLSDRVVYSDSADRELSVRENMLHLLNVLLILKTAIMTRIEGNGKIGLNQRFMMIPIGGKSVFAAGDTFTSRMSKLIKELRDLSHRHWEDKRLEYVYTSLTRILGSARISLISSKQQNRDDDELARRPYLALIPSFSDDFADAVHKGFDRLLQQPPLERGYVSGGLLIVPIVQKSMQEEYWMEIEGIFEQNGKERDLLTSMRELSWDQRYPESLQVAMRDAIALIELLKDMVQGKMPRYEQESDHTDQHYALPLFMFLTRDMMREYFKGKQEREEDSEMSFRSLLTASIRSQYPADSILPIGSSYDEFPFVVFRSLNLGEARRKMFTGRYLFMSHEFNILNMLLSSKQ